MRVTTYKTEHVVATGDKETFESQLNTLSEGGWIWTGSLTTTLTSEGAVVYHQLMSKTIPVSEAKEV